VARLGQFTGAHVLVLRWMTLSTVYLKMERISRRFLPSAKKGTSGDGCGPRCQHNSSELGRRWQLLPVHFWLQKQVAKPPSMLLEVLPGFNCYERRRINAAAEVFLVLGLNLLRIQYIVKLRPIYMDFCT
jgi:hypothetical protein